MTAAFQRPAASWNASSEPQNQKGLSCRKDCTVGVHRGNGEGDSGQTLGEGLQKERWICFYQGSCGMTMMVLLKKKKPHSKIN